MIRLRLAIACMGLLALGQAYAQERMEQVKTRPPRQGTLAEGPADIKLSYYDKTNKKSVKDEGTLIELRPEKLVYLSAKDGPRTLLAFQPNAFIESVESKDGKFKWEVDKKGKIAGPSMPVKGFNLTSLPQEQRASEDAFQVMLLDRLMTRLENDPEMANFIDLKEEILKWRKYTAKRQVTAETTKMKETLAFLNGQLEKLTDISKLLEKRLELREKFGKDNPAKLEQIRQKLDDNDTAMQINSVYRSYWVDYGFYWYVPYGQTRARGVEMRKRQDKLMKELKVAEEQFKQMEEAGDKFTAAMDKLRSDFYAYAEKQYSYPDSDAREAEEKLVARLKSASDLNYLADHYAKTRNSLYGKYNPFPVIQEAYARAMSPGQEPRERPKTIMEWVAKIVEAARLIPPSKEYDSVRVHFLTEAASLAELAVVDELKGKNWKGSLNLPALTIIRLTDEILDSYREEIDLSGLVRELRAWSLFQNGRHDEALKVAEGLRELRSTSPAFFYNLARLQVAQDPAQHSAALDSMRTAIKAGGGGILQYAFNDPNLFASFGPKTKHYNEYCRIMTDALEWNFTRSTASSKPAVELINKTSATLKNVTIYLSSNVDGKTTTMATHKIQNFPAGEKIIWTPEAITRPKAKGTTTSILTTNLDKQRGDHVIVTWGNKDK